LDIGYSAIAVALIATVISFILFIYYIRKQDESVYSLSRTALYAQTLLLTAAVVILLYYFLSRDFNVEYVALYSDSSLPLSYTIGAIWGGQSGSLLLWAWIISIFMTFIVLNERKDKITGYTLAVLLSVNIFLILLLVTINNPFHRLSFFPEDGSGLNPLLINPGMLIHPPTLFIGYAGLTIPFAYAIAGLLTKNEIWIFRVRKYTLFSWLFLGFGIFLGGWWSYVVLGWGGYWAWDPVENASLIPWLISSALLHSIMLQESQRGMKLWNVLLSISAFETVLLATFITRSGLISSVHAFGSTGIGIIFAGYIVLTLLVSLGILAFRFDQVKSINIFKSVKGREVSFLFNTLFFVIMAITILWGTLFPMLNEAVFGVKISVGQGFYNAVTPYVMLSLVVLMGICIILRWGTTSSTELLHKLKYPFCIGLASIPMSYFLGFTEISSLIGFSATIFAVAVHFEDYWFDVKDYTRKTQKKIFRSMLHILVSRRRRYGGYIVHLSMFLIFIGIIGSTIYETNYSATLQTNIPQEIGGYNFTYTGFSTTQEPISTNSHLNILVNKGNFADTITPIMSENLKTQSTYVNIGILNLPFEDIYVIPEAVNQYQISITINYIPLINLLWYGGILMIFGVILGLLPKSLVERK